MKPDLEPPQWAGVRLGPALAGALYTLLVGSFALTLWTRRFPGALPYQLDQGAPWLFLVFMGVFAFYRLGLVRARKYPAAKAFFQIGVGVLLFTLMLPSASRPFIPVAGAPVASDDALETLLHDSNPHYRALGAELAGRRGEEGRYGSTLVRALDDENAEVQAQAHRALVGLTGRDLGSPGTQEGKQAWRERYP